ncbi:MAG: hypothetical protein J0H08_16165, partial [Rhizobiales bacterium]|nr:hypothetical protein [Hyphomicrobiales bacterium]
MAELDSHGLRLAAHRAVIEDFRITVKGSILDPARPGLVHRIVFSMGGEELGSTLAREPEKGGRPPGAGHFSCTFPVPERLLDSGLTLRVVGSPAEFALR